MKFSIVILLIVFLLIFAFLLYKVDCSIPRLSDSVLLIGAALRLCQQLKDKVHNDIVIVKGRLPGWLQDNLAFSTELMMLIRATVESFYGRYFVSSFNSDKGSMLKKSVLETWDQYQYLGNCSPTPPLTQQQSIDNKLRLMLS